MRTHETISARTVELETPEGLRAVVNPEGAFVESLMTPSGEHLLFPRQSIGDSDRGGVPVCAPTFGPSDQIGLPRHGYARNLAWKSWPRQNATSARFTLEDPHTQIGDESLKAYEFAKFDLCIGINSSEDIYQLNSKLLIKNNGNWPFVAAPGFHPYFPAPDPSKQFQVTSWRAGEESLDISKLEMAAELTRADKSDLYFEIGSRLVTISSEGLAHAVVWTADPSEYICVEPTEAGAVVSETPLADLDAYQLMPGEEKTYNMQITWE